MDNEVRVCRDCGQEFTITAREWAWLARKGFEQTPFTRCAACRAEKRREREVERAMREKLP